MSPATFPYCFVFILFFAVHIINCPKVEAAQCNIAAVEVKNFLDNNYADWAAKSYENMTKKYDHLTYHVVRVKNLSELQSKVVAEFTKQKCSCITELHIVGHGSPGNVSVGDGMVTNANEHINGKKANTTEWQPVLTHLSARLCDRATVFLVGCRTGSCNKGRNKLYEVAKLMKKPVTAPLDIIDGDKIYDYILNGRWQMAQPTARPAHKATNRGGQAPSRRAEAGDAYQCSCDNGVYSALQECVNNCQASLSCYYGICNRVHTNNRWGRYAGNPVMTPGITAAAAAAATAVVKKGQRPASTRGSLMEHGPVSPSVRTDVSAVKAAIAGWDDYGVSQPAVVKQGPVYQAWYVGWDASNIDRIGYAESFDGVHWTKFADNPVLHEGPAGSWDESGAYNPTVIVEETASGDPMYKMWYTGYSTTAKLARIGYATSPDGLVWTKHHTYVLDVGPYGAWDSAGVGECHVIKDGNQYKMWFGGSDAWQWWRTGYATSPDGITWTRHASNPILREGPAGTWDEWAASAPAVVKVDGKYHMYYGGLDSNDVARIGYAHSRDGISWVKAPDNPQLTEGLEAGAWDSGNVYHATFFIDRNESLYKMLYRGTDGSNYGLGFAATSLLETTSSSASSILSIMGGILGAQHEKQTK